jgi:hypothetical protein
MFPRHFDGKRFYNPDAPQVPGLLDAFRWKLTTRPQPSPSFIEDVKPSIAPRRWEASGLRTTLVNHSTVLLQQRGFNILTDPIWSERTRPLSWIGPRRRRNPGVPWENLPPVDALLISHNHYDHLDLSTLRRLPARGDSTFIVPVGAIVSVLGGAARCEYSFLVLLAGASALARGRNAKRRARVASR